MDALRIVSAGLENTPPRAAQGIEALRERDGREPSRPEQSAVVPSVQVDLSEAARAAARSGISPPPPPIAVNAPAIPVQIQEAVVRAGDTDRAQTQDVAAFTASSREAVQRYMENADNKLPIGQSGPSSVRVSA